MDWDGPKWGQEDFFTANPDLADILGRLDLDVVYVSKTYAHPLPRVVSEGSRCSAVQDTKTTLGAPGW